jgi:FkbM family methyltransferase
MNLFGYVRTFRNWYLYYQRRRGRRHSDREAAVGRPPVILELLHRNGLRVAVRAATSDFTVARSIFVHLNYLPEGMEIPENAVVVDVGANIGCFTIQAAQRATSGRLFAYEPEPGNFAMLRENVSRNGFDRVRTFQAAVADREGEMSLHYSDGAGNTTTHSLYGKGARTLSVPVTTLPRLMEEHGLDRIDYLKLDCEGAEPIILSSAPEDCLRKVKRIAVEVNNPRERMREPLARLRGLGFRELPASRDNMKYLVRDG